MISYVAAGSPGMAMPFLRRKIEIFEIVARIGQLSSGRRPSF
jgi:hypothetical protein